MIDKIRIYYESIEQAEHYIKPIMESSLHINKLNIQIELVKLKGSSKYYSKNVAPIIFWKDPDILVTFIVGKIEYPLLVIEFSNAVFTEDHELQRFDGLVAAAENNCIYLKISPLNKQSQSDHGGNIDFDYLGPFALILKKYGRVFYHFDWECDNSGIVKVDETYLSCPKKIPNLENFFDYLIRSQKDNFNFAKWTDVFEKVISSDKNFKSWKEELDTFSFPDLKDLNSSRTEWIESKKQFILKLNRFGHAMDPERGMLSYYGTFYNKTVSKMLFDKDNNAWYKDISKEQDIETYIGDSGLKKGYDFLYCFMLGSGLYNNLDFKSIVSKYKENKDNVLEVDISNFLDKNYLLLNKAMRTIFKNSVYFYIVDKNNQTRVILKWGVLNIKETYSESPNITAIKERENFDEDDVTYIGVHNILKQNGYIILAVSYPGAQADRVVLIAPGTGRKQQRRYIDIISYLPKKFSNLQENKGKYSPTEIQKEINELARYKTETEYKNAINSFIDRFDKNAPKLIRIGVGFWANSKFTVSKIKEIDIRKLDYFVYLTSDRKEWYIWSTGKEKMFTKTNGKITIPLTFEVINNSEIVTQKLDEFF